MFVMLSADWYLNLDKVAEVLFSEEQGQRRAKITSWQVNEFGEEKLMEWYITGPDAGQLQAALDEVRIRTPQRNDVVL
jgi:hypothetical protein